MGMAIKDKLVFWPFAVCTVAFIALVRWPMPWVMLVGLLLSGGVAYWRLGRK
jgi:chromate transporter